MVAGGVGDSVTGDGVAISIGAMGDCVGSGSGDCVGELAVGVSDGVGSGVGSGWGSTGLGEGSGKGVGVGCGSGSGDRVADSVTTGESVTGSNTAEEYSTLTISFLYQPGQGSPNTSLVASIVPEEVPTNTALTVFDTSIPQSMSIATYLATTFENTLPSGACASKTLFSFML
jgi:hypothetical protein